MKILENLTAEERDHLRLKVGNTYLNLEIRNYHHIFQSQCDILLKLFGKGYNEEIKLFLCCITYSLKRLDLGFYLVRNSKHYLTFNKEHPKQKKISHYKLMKMLDKLEQKGFIENYSGYNNRETGEHMSSCVVFTDKLIDLFPQEHVDKFGSSYVIDHAIVRETVKIEGGEEIVVELKNVQGIGKHRKEIKEMSDWLNTHSFRFVTYPKKVDLQRIFFERIGWGGRIYFGGLQCLESGKRPLYIIDGKPVIELDYKSNHLLIIAEKKEILLPEDFDPYGVDLSHLIKCDDPKKIRSIIKICCMFLLNSGIPEATFKKFWKKNISIIDKFVKEGDWNSAKANLFYGVTGLSNSKAIIRAIESYNSYAKSHFRIAGGVWDELQYLDSEILLRIMRKMKAIDAPFLPYHDSVVTCFDYEKQLEGFMYDAWAEVLGSNFNCRVAKKF